MQIILDHLAASIIAMTVLLTLAGVLLTAQRSAVDATADYASRTQMLSFIETMERDFLNMGAGVAPTDPMILEYDWDSPTKRLVFRGAVDTLTTAPVQKIRYTLVPRDTVQVKEAGQTLDVPTYAVERDVEVAGTYQPSGGSAPVLAEFDIALLTSSGAPVGASLNNTRVVAVRMRVVSVLGSTGTSGQASWQTRYRPISLAMHS